MSWSEIAQQVRNDAAYASAAGLSVAMLVASNTVFAQQASSANTVGASVPGIPTQIYTKPADSTGGVTQATSANKGMQCATGQVLSGGACVPLSQLVPNTSCAYGQVSSGGSCVPLSTLTPPTTSCPTGYVLSGGNCVPLSSPTTPAPTSCGGGAFTLVWGVGCSYSNSVPVTASGQAVFLTNTAYGYSGNATYQCNNGQWASLNQYCVQTTPPPPSNCPAISGGMSWGGGCSAAGTIPSTANGGTYTVNSTAPNWTGSRTYQCNNGSWAEISAPCNYVPPPPANCDAGNVNWSSCSAYASYTAHGAYTPTLTNTAPNYTGSAQFSCNNGNLSVVSGATCNAVPPPPPPPAPVPYSCQPLTYYGIAWVQGYTGTAVPVYQGAYGPAATNQNDGTYCVKEGTNSHSTVGYTSGCNPYGQCNTPSGLTVTIYDFVSPKTGSVTAICDNSVWTIISATCN